MGFAFQPSLYSLKATSREKLAPLRVVLGDNESIVDKTHRILQDFPPVNESFESYLKHVFPNAISNSELEWKVVTELAEHGFRADNTLLATSLCSDELARQLQDDFVKIYGNNFNLGGLAAFPFAGNTGFQTMSGHIPDDGFCLLVHGPHVGFTRDGAIGMVERKGVLQHDVCCTSAIKASNNILGQTQTAGNAMDIFMDIQQSAVQDLIAPFGDRLQNAEYPMLELPYAIYESQQQLIQEIVYEGIFGVKQGIAMLGGVQINTGPDTLDYFHPLCFSLLNNRGEIVEDMLPKLS